VLYDACYDERFWSALRGFWGAHRRVRGEEGTMRAAQVRGQVDKKGLSELAPRVLSAQNAWLMNSMMRRYRQTQSEHQKKYYADFMSSRPCERCNGRRLKEEVLHVRIEGNSIMDVTDMTIAGAHDFLSNLKLSGNKKLIAEEMVKEIISRLGFLLNVGLDYLTLSRKGPTLSGGESQRIRLASQIGSELTGVLYILDEPSIGLHQRDNLKLLKTLQHLRDIGGTDLGQHTLDLGNLFRIVRVGGVDHRGSEAPRRRIACRQPNGTNLPLAQPASAGLQCDTGQLVIPDNGEICHEDIPVNRTDRTCHPDAPADGL